MPTTAAYRQALAYRLHDFELVAVTSATSSAVVVSTLVSPTVGVTSNKYAGGHLFHRTGTASPQSRGISSYDPVTGTLVPEVAMVAPSPGDLLDLTRLFPAHNNPGADTDYRTITNRALGRMLIEREDTTSISAGDDSIDVPWASLDRPERLLQVREPSPVSGRSPVDASWRDWQVVPDVPTARLQCRVPFLSATTLTVEWTSPASKYIAVGGVWAESTTGLLNETDVAQPSVEEWLPFALEEALLVLIARSPGRPSAEWERMLAQAREDITVSRYRDRTQMIGQAPPEGEAA